MRREVGGAILGSSIFGCKRLIIWRCLLWCDTAKTVGLKSCLVQKPVCIFDESQKH